MNLRPDSEAGTGRRTVQAEGSYRSCGPACPAKSYSLEALLPTRDKDATGERLARNLLRQANYLF